MKSISNKTKKYQIKEIIVEENVIVKQFRFIKTHCVSSKKLKKHFLNNLKSIKSKKIIERVQINILNKTRPNCALDRRTNLCLYVPGFPLQVFKQVKILSERSEGTKEQKKKKGATLLQSLGKINKKHT